ncbi:Protein of unknown function [Gryllus bimaculatus]|nr:Protein of unknown function [Gryllus bimaculatus]
MLRRPVPEQRRKSSLIGGKIMLNKYDGKSRRIRNPQHSFSGTGFTTPHVTETSVIPSLLVALNSSIRYCLNNNQHAEFREGLEKRKYLINQLQSFMALKQELEVLSHKDASPNMPADHKKVKKEVTKQLEVLKKEIARTEELVADLDKKMTSFENTIKKLEKELKDGKVI